MSIFGSIGRTIYQLGFQVSPIIFTGGIASEFFGYLPIIAITEAASFVTGILNGSVSTDLDQFFAHFSPVAGGKLANFSVATFPFANQQVAANAIIVEPLTLSVRMIIPVNKPGGHTAKLATMMALQAAIKKHALMGGLYTIATPTFLYTDCILTGLTDVSSGDSPIPQNTFQWDFYQPLVTIANAQAAQSTFMSAATNGTPTSGSFNAPAAGGAITSIAGSNPTGMLSSFANLLNPFNAL